MNLFKKNRVNTKAFPMTKGQSFSASDYCEAGKKAMEAGKNVEAMEYFQAAIEIDPKNEEAYLLLIDVYRALGREQDVQKTIQKLQIEIPNHSPITPRSKPHVVTSGSNKHNSSSKHEIINLILRGAVETVKKICFSIGSISGKSVFRLLLYVITTINVIQLLAAVTRVTTWSVWDWGLLFDVLGILVGIIGVCITILLPAGLVLWGILRIENSPSVNHAKTNIFFLILNAFSIYCLFRFSNITYEITKRHYSNYGEWIERIDVSLWSWNHLWLFFRPLIYFIGGAIALLIILIIGNYLILALSYLGRQIHKFFTT